MYSNFRVIATVACFNICLFSGTPEECVRYMIDFADNNDFDEEFEIALSYTCHDCDCCTE